MATALTTARLALGDIKLAHSVFAMPFALLATVMAYPAGYQASEMLAPLALIVLCMFLARTWAMLVNRIVDARFDRENPRTAGRAIASGRLSQRGALIVASLCALLFVGATFGFRLLANNSWPLVLSIPVLVWIGFYSVTKRFTALAHLFLGGALAVSPIAAVIAIWPEHLGLARDLSLFAGVSPTGQSVLWMAGFVLLWVAGFDIAYALQDMAFDRKAGLHSVPAKLGLRRSLWIARAAHTGGLACLLLVTWAEPRFGALMIVATVLVGCTLVLEHIVLHRRGIAGLPLAFFTLNGVIALVIGALGILDLILLNPEPLPSS